MSVITARKRSCGKVMFLHLCVILFMGVGFPACTTEHMTKVIFSQVSVILLTGGMGRGVCSQGVSTPGGCVCSHRWGLVLWAARILLECILVTVYNSSCGKVMFPQVCVKNSVHWGGGGVHPPPDGRGSGRYASYWNAFLLHMFFLLSPD